MADSVLNGNKRCSSHRWQDFLQRVDNASVPFEAEERRWRLQGAALRRGAEHCLETYNTPQPFRLKPKAKGLIVQALVGLTTLNVASGTSPTFTAGIKGFFHTVTDAMYSAFFHVDRHLRFPSAAASTLTNRVAMSEEVVNPVIHHADNISFPAQSDFDVLPIRNEVIGRFLLVKGYLALEPEEPLSASQIVVAAIDLIQTKKKGEKLLAMRLRRHSGLYGGWRNEPTSLASHQEENRKWMSENIFGGPIDAFIVKAIKNSEMSVPWNTKRLYQTVLKTFNSFFIRDTMDIKTADAIGWAWDNVVLKQLPLLQYVWSQSIMALRIDNFIWGQIHAGLLWSQNISLNASTIPTDEASSMGSFLIAGIKNGVLPYSWMRFFSLPAMLRHSVIYPLGEVSDEHVLGGYFNDREEYLNTVYPIEEFARLMTDYKKRSALDYSTSRFVEQNNAIAACYAKIDKIVISAALSNLPKEDYDFLFSAELRKIDAEYSWVKPWYFFGMAPEEAASINNLHKIRLPSNVDLLLADKGIEERIYALWQQDGGVQCRQMRSDSDYVTIFNDNRPLVDPGFELSIQRGGREVKKQFETLHIAINRLVEIRQERVNQRLFNYGYDRTTSEIVGDVLLSLIPFYTCITEARQGNVEQAIQACIMDVMSLAIPSTKLAIMASRMAELLGVEAMLAVNYVLTRYAMQESLKRVTQQGMKQFFYYGVYGSAQMVGWQHLALLARAVDPGFEICYLLGRMSVRQAVRLGRLMINITPGLEKNLSKVTEELLMKLPDMLPFNNHNVVGHIGKTPVKKIGFDSLSSLDVYVSFSHETGELRGYKYYRLADGTFKMVPHDVRHEFINLNMLQQGLGGGGAPVQGQIWAQETRDAAEAQEVVQAPSSSGTRSYSDIDAQLLTELTQMSFDEFLLQGGLEGVANANNVDPDALKRYMDEARRLTPLGKRMLDIAQAGPSREDPKKGILRRAYNGYRHRYLLSLWLQMTEAERVQIGGLAGFAAHNHVELVRLKRYLRIDGTPNGVGNSLLASREFDMAEAETFDVMPKRIANKRPKYRGDLHRELLMLWREMTPVERNREGGVIGFSEKHGVDPETLNSYLKEDFELNRSGETLVNRKEGKTEGKSVSRSPRKRGRYHGTLNRHILSRWHKMTREQRIEAAGFKAFVERFGIYPDHLSAYVTRHGEINVAGMRFLTATLKHPKPFDANEFSQPVTLAATEPDLVLTEIPLTESTPHQQGGGLSETTDLDDGVTVKEEPLEAELPGPRHQIDDNLPVLQSAENNRLSVLAQAEGNIDDLKVTNWSDLHEAFATVSRETLPAVKRRILAEAKSWLHSEGDHQARFGSMVYAAFDFVEGPDRGISIFAHRPIAQFEVIGPYSGVLHASVESLHAEMEQVGAVNVNTYLWATRSSQRALSAFGHGNTLSLVNTGHLPGYPAWRENNLSAIRIGKNLIFYVAMRDIRMNEELLVSYGEDFNPSGAR